MVFEDDIRKRDPSSRFFFEVDAFDRANIPPQPGTYYLSAMFGPYLSNIVELRL
ncbi:hypothetical protein [Archangium sp.]|uniref:hypothetical protein n=1 Tax=Archangium sp. TaxID=1872627 RepID=UPI002D264B4B|nr:hypothetical protein [Archangium sp.]HYO58701.1 hypothetical protein [Archangium sp.]